jgi:hypothetical protein
VVASSGRAARPLGAPPRRASTVGRGHRAAARVLDHVRSVQRTSRQRAVDDAVVAAPRDAHAAHLHARTTTDGFSSIAPTARIPPPALMIR